MVLAARGQGPIKLTPASGQEIFDVSPTAVIAVANVAHFGIEHRVTAGLARCSPHRMIESAVRHVARGNPHRCEHFVGTVIEAALAPIEKRRIKLGMHRREGFYPRLFVSKHGGQNGAVPVGVGGCGERHQTLPEGQLAHDLGRDNARIEPAGKRHRRLSGESQRLGYRLANKLGGALDIILVAREPHRCQRMGIVPAFDPARSRGQSYDRTLRNAPGAAKPAFVGHVRVEEQAVTEARDVEFLDKPGGEQHARHGGDDRPTRIVSVEKGGGAPRTARQPQRTVGQLDD